MQFADEDDGKLPSRLEAAHAATPADKEQNVNGNPLVDRPPDPGRVLDLADPAIQKLIEEKNLRANEALRVAGDTVSRCIHGIAAATCSVCTRPKQVASTPADGELTLENTRVSATSLLGPATRREIESGRRFTVAPSKPKPKFALEMDVLGRLKPGETATLGVREGFTKAGFRSSIQTIAVKTLDRKFNSTIETEGDVVKFTRPAGEYRHGSSKAARKPQEAPAPEVVPTILPEPETPTEAESGAALAAVAEAPVHSENCNVRRLLDGDEAAGAQDRPVSAVVPDVARQGAVLRIEDIVPGDPPEAAELVNLMLEYHCGDWPFSSLETEDRLMDNVNLQAELAQAIQRHRRAKQITDMLITAWAADWEFAGTEPPFADLARRVHASLVEVMAQKKGVAPGGA